MNTTGLRQTSCSEHASLMADDRLAETQAIPRRPVVLDSKNMVAVHSAEQRRDKRAIRSLATIQYCDGDFLILQDGTRIGPFSSHWAACAAMIRRTDPSFVSLGGDKTGDLAIEREALDRECPDCGTFDCQENH